MKKLSLTLGSLTAVVVPVVSVVSCGPDTPKKIVNITKSDIKFYGPNGYGKASNKFQEVKYLKYFTGNPHYTVSVNKKNLSNGDKVKVTIKTDEKTPVFANLTHEQTLECVVSGLTEKTSSLHDADLKDPEIIRKVNKSLIDYSHQRQSKIFYNFENITYIPEHVFNSWFVFKDNQEVNRITSLPENIDFSGLVTLEKYNFDYVKQLPENIDLSNLREVNGLNRLTSLPENIDLSNLREVNELNGLTSLPENIDFSSVQQLERLNGLTSLPKNIDLSSLQYIKGLNGLTSLPENIDFSSVQYINGLNGLTSLPENIDFSSVQNIEQLNGLTSLPENIDFSRVTVFGQRFSDSPETIPLQKLASLPNSIRFNNAITWGKFQKAFPQLLKLYDEQWFNSHKKASTTP